MKQVTMAMVLSLLVVGTVGAAAGVKLEHRWVYISTNLLVNGNVERTLKLLRRVRKAGYTGVVLADSKFMRWDDLPARYAANVRRIRQRCSKLKLDLIACVMPIGYSNSLLSRDPNLAAGLPVVEAPFRVARTPSGAARLVPDDSSCRLLNGDFEQFRGHRPAGWDWLDRPGEISFIDTRVVYHGKASLRMQDIDKYSPRHGHGRIMQRLKVKPYRYYHVSAAVKTENFSAARNVRIAVLAKGASLNYYNPRIAPTQDWKRIDICFNSLQFDQVRLYLGVWGGRGGKIWWDDVRLEPAGLVNIVRRPGAPVRLTSADGKTTYVEGRDFAPLRDPLLGRDPYGGAYTVWHKPPSIEIPPGSRLRAGQRVLLSYFHTALIYWGQVCCCMSEPKVYDILAWQVRQVRDHLHPDGYFMQHDEIRVAGWDESCRRRGLTPGEVLADNVSRCVAIIKKADPGKDIYVWSDMFDPHHNARKTGRYYLVKGDGPWYGSWKGLPPEVIVVNWHGHQPGRLESLKHFAARGHRQILAGYYDHPPERITDWLRDAAKVKGIIGAMYTTWRRNYDDLETFAQRLRGFAVERHPARD